MKKYGISGIIETHSIQELENRDDNIGKTIKKLNSFGAYNDVQKFIKTTAKKLDMPELLDYIKPISEYADKNTRVIVTTHKKFLNANESFLKDYEVIIDEDILLSTSKNSVSVLISDLEKIRSYAKVKTVLSEKSDNKYIKTEPQNIYIVELSRNVQSKNALNMINIDKCT